MNQSYTKANVIDFVKGRLLFFVGSQFMSDENFSALAEQSSTKINKLVNDSDSTLYSVDSITEGDVVLAASVIDLGFDIPVVTGLNTITLNITFPDTNFFVEATAYLGTNEIIVSGVPFNLTQTTFDIIVAEDGFLRYFAAEPS